MARRADAAPEQNPHSPHGRHHRSRGSVVTGKAKPFLHAGFVQGPATAQQRESEISSFEFEIECNRWPLVEPAPALGYGTCFPFHAFRVAQLRRRNGKPSA